MTPSIFEEPRKGQFTQGTIFSCGFAEKYLGLPEIHGLVITARCDAAQLKVPIYSFVPVVPLTHWVFKDGAQIVLQRIVDDAENTLENILNDCDVSTTLLRTSERGEIVEKVLRPMLAQNRRMESKIQKFEMAGEVIDKAIEALNSGERTAVHECLRKSVKFLDKTIKDLSENKILGHYLLRQMPTLSGADADYVALLREVHHIPNGVVQRIVNGISKDDWLNHEVSASCCPNFANDEDFCMPVARIRSPWIEHLMQSWALLFTRIGVEDQDSLSVRRGLDKIGLRAS